MIIGIYFPPKDSDVGGFFNINIIPALTYHLFRIDILVIIPQIFFNEFENVHRKLEALS